MLEGLLTRIDTSDQGTFGHFVLEDFWCYTCELPRRDNAPNISCVPPSDYSAILSFSPRFGMALYLVGPVRSRSGIRIHPANLAGDVSKGYKSQLNGCIALGERLGWMDGQKSVLLSRPAVRRLGETTGGRPFKLTIEEKYDA